MPTQGDAWRHAWAHVDEVVRRGVLTSGGAPSKGVRQSLFRTVFPELPTHLTAYVHRGDPISDTEQDLIERAIREHGADLVALTLVATFVRGWFVTTPQVARRRAAERNVADLWAPRLREMIRDAGGIRPLAQRGDQAWATWLEDYYHVEATRPGDLLADAEAIRAYVLADGVEADLVRRIRVLWAARPGGPADTPGPLEPVGLHPDRVPQGAARAAIEELADARLASWTDDALSRALGLTDTPAGIPLPAPPVRRAEDDTGEHRWRSVGDPGDEDDEESAGRLPRPRDRSLLLRLIHRNRRGSGSDTREITVEGLVSEEIERSTGPLGLLEPASRRALVAAGASLAQSRWIDDPRDVYSVPADHPDKYLLQIAVQLRRCFFAAHTSLELLPEETHRRISRPIDTLGPRLWSRLHNWERDGKMTDPYQAVRFAWRSWLKDLPKPGTGSPPAAVPLDALPGAPGIDGGPVDPRVSLPPALLPHEDVVTALRHLAESLGAEAREFVEDVWSGYATEAEWAAVTARTEALAPGIIDPWPAFAAVLDYLTQLRSDDS